MSKTESVCQNCGDLYSVNFRLNDGCCNDCRQELNSKNFEGDTPVAEIEASLTIAATGEVERFDSANQNVGWT